MSVGSVTRRGRRAAEALMADSCRITRTTGPLGPLDPETGEKAPAPTATVYEGKCRVQTYEAQESRPESGDHVYAVQRYSVHIPAGTTVRVGDVVTVLSATLDPDLTNRRYTVTGLLHKTFATANRLLVDEIVR